MSILARNKEANFNYKIEHKLEAGIVLSGQEVKSAKAGNVSLKGSYVTVRSSKADKSARYKATDHHVARPFMGKGPEAFLVNAHISPYEMAHDLKGYEPTRERKLLLKKQEITSLIGKYKEQGMALVPLDLHTKKGLVKVSIGIGRGKKKYDKRESIKKRETDRKIKRALRKRR